MAQTSERDRRSPGLIEVRVYGIRGLAASAMGLMALVVVLAFAAGVTVPVILGMTSLARADLNTIVISAATLCLGLGLASIAFQHRRAAENSALLAQADSLRSRADVLMREYDAYMDRQTAMNREHRPG